MLKVILAISWSLFQLCVASWLTLDARITRIIHLLFALSLAYLMTKDPSRKDYLEEKSITKKPIKQSPWRTYSYLIIFLFLSVFASLYLLHDQAKIVFRSGSPTGLDIIAGVFLFMALLEACRRVVGPVLSLTAIVFSGYIFLGSHLPSFLQFKSISLSRFIGQIYMTDEGIFGTPLDTSANVVFLFVLFGSLLQKTGGGLFFLNLALSLVGRFKGGAAKAAVAGSGLIGMISGSSIANIVTTGNFTIPLMKKTGYPAKKAAAIEVAASTDGQIMPPIMGAAAFIMAATIPGISFYDIIIAALIPALVSYLTLFYITHLEASKHGLKGISHAELPKFMTTFISGMHFIIPIFLLLYQLFIIRSSPNRAAFISIISIFIITLIKALFVSNKEQRITHFKKTCYQLIQGLESGAKNMVGVALATAGAGIIVAIVSLGLGSQINTVIDALSFNSLFLMLLWTAIFSLIVGMGLPTTATYVVMASLTIPSLTQLSQAQDFFIPIVAAHLFCFYFGILADDTPPVGLAAYAASAISKSPPIATGIQAFSYDVRTAIIPFMFILNPSIILHNISNIWLGIFIFIMTLLGSFCFASVIQNYCFIKNTKVECCLFILASIVFFQPQWIIQVLSISGSSLWGYSFGIFILAIILLLQYRRKANAL